TDGCEAETAVQLLRALVRHPDLEGEAVRSAVDGLTRQREQQTAADLVPMPRGVDGDGGHVRVLQRHHETAVADEVAPDARDEIRARRAQRELAQEQRRAPRPRVHLVL